MSKLILAKYLREDAKVIEKKKEPGPFVTISREYGCDGYCLGDILAQRLNERIGEDKWQVFRKDILKQLAQDSGVTVDMLEKEQYSKPSVMKDFLCGMRQNSIPDGLEIRNKITLIVRTVAFEGYAIIIGQGGTSACWDFNNGLSVKLEAPREWRIARVCARENLKKEQATEKIEDIEKQREYLRKIYERKNPRRPAFDITLDNSRFNINQAAELIIFVMEQKGLVPKESKQQGEP